MTLQTFLALTLLGTTFLQAPPVFAEDVFARCPDDQLSAPAGLARQKWAYRCDTRFRRYLDKWRDFNQGDPSLNIVGWDSAANTYKKGTAEELKKRDQALETFIFQHMYEGALELAYPSYNFYRPDDSQAGALWRAPTDEAIDCSVKPNNVKYYRFCPAGCYTADQLLSFSDGQISIADKVRDTKGSTDKGYITTLTSDSTLDRLEYKQTQVATFLSDSVAAPQRIVKIATEENGYLSVTENHPLLLADGRMVQAKSLKVGDSLIRADGRSVAIIKVRTKTEKLKTYNVLVKSNDLRERIIVAQGFLSGDLYYQNAGAKFIESMILRDPETIPESAL